MTLVVSLLGAPAFAVGHRHDAERDNAEADESAPAPSERAGSRTS